MKANITTQAIHRRWGLSVERTICVQYRRERRGWGVSSDACLGCGDGSFGVEPLLKFSHPSSFGRRTFGHSPFVVRTATPERAIPMFAVAIGKCQRVDLGLHLAPAVVSLPS
jgi:hypothetical protein